MWTQASGHLNLVQALKCGGSVPLRGSEIILLLLLIKQKTTNHMEQCEIKTKIFITAISNSYIGIIEAFLMDFIIDLMEDKFNCQHVGGFMLIAAYNKHIFVAELNYGISMQSTN